MEITQKKMTFTPNFIKDLKTTLGNVGLMDFTPEGAEGQIEIADPMTSSEDITTVYVLRETGIASKMDVSQGVALGAVYLNEKDKEGKLIDANPYEQLGLMISAVFRNRG